MTVESLLRQAKVLTPDERCEFAVRLLEMDADQPLSDAMMAEFDRRIAAFDSNPAIGVPWEVVKERARKRVRGSSEPGA